MESGKWNNAGYLDLGDLIEVLSNTHFSAIWTFLRRGHNYTGRDIEN